jgi:hypothetical protein
MKAISWSKLGAPKKPQDVRVKGLGVVEIRQGHIAAAKSAGGDPEFELFECTAAGDTLRRYSLGQRL